MMDIEDSAGAPITGNQCAVLGKPIGSDAENGKSTYPSLLGIARCHELVRELSEQAIHALAPFSDAGMLPALARTLAERKY